MARPAPVPWIGPISAVLVGHPMDAGGTDHTYRLEHELARRGGRRGPAPRPGPVHGHGVVRRVERWDPALRPSGHGSAQRPGPAGRGPGAAAAWSARAPGAPTPSGMPRSWVTRTPPTTPWPAWPCPSTATTGGWACSGSSTPGCPSSTRSSARGSCASPRCWGNAWPPPGPASPPHRRPTSRTGTTSSPRAPRPPRPPYPSRSPPPRVPPPRPRATRARPRARRPATSWARSPTTCPTACWSPAPTAPSSSPTPPSRA